MKYALKGCVYLILFITLTITTQIGGFILLLSFVIAKYWKYNFRLKTPIIFILGYFLSTFFIVPFIAPFFGREKIEASSTLQPATIFTIILNRNYVKPQLHLVLKELSYELPIRFLDANFPFINKFPLLPHLSHNDGCKIDLSFIYQTQNGEISNKLKSVSGYGVFESPINGEHDQTLECKKLGYFQYDYPKYLSFGNKNLDLQFSEKATKKLILKILDDSRIEKIFLEPHLVSRLQLSNEKIRFHGCKAVRHDDHIHIQIKK